MRGLRTAYVNALDELWSVEIQARGNGEAESAIMRRRTVRRDSVVAGAPAGRLAALVPGRVVPAGRGDPVGPDLNI